MTPAMTDDLDTDGLDPGDLPSTIPLVVRRAAVGVEQALVPAGAVPLMVMESVQKPSAAESATYSL